jgi:hypothetical protein
MPYKIGCWQHMLTRPNNVYPRVLNRVSGLLLPFVIVFLIAPLGAKSQKNQAEPIGFNANRVGMSFTEFRTLHPPLGLSDRGPICRYDESEHSVIWCSYKDEYPENPLVTHKYDPQGDPSSAVPLGIDAMFIDEKLALIQAQLPSETRLCLELPLDLGTSPRYHFERAGCNAYPPLWKALTGRLGTAVRIAVVSEHSCYTTFFPCAQGQSMKDFSALRWENTVSMAEFQIRACGPWDNTSKGWSKLITEALEGRFCGNEDGVSPATVMLYLDKELSRKAASLILKGTND